MPRPRKYATAAERQKAYRERRSVQSAFPVDGIGPGFDLPEGFNWTVNIEEPKAASGGSSSFCAALFRERDRAEVQAERLRSMVRKGVVVTVRPAYRR